MKTSLRSLLLALMVVAAWTAADAQIKAAASGNWGDAATWVGGVVPGPTDDVVVDTAITVKINSTNAQCNNLTAKGYVLFDETGTDYKITINGSLFVDKKGRFRSGSATPTGARVHHITLFKNLTVDSAGSFDMRIGSSSTVSVGRLTFAGSTNSEIRLYQPTYVSSIEEFNSVIINKTGTARVIVVGGHVIQNNNTTNSADTLILINGIVEVRDTCTWVHLATSSGAVQGANPNSYVIGSFGRGISNTGTPPITRTFEVGDESGYRPITIRTATVGNSTGHRVMVKAVSGNANTGSSTFSGGIDKVSSVRYYKVSYVPGGGAPTMTLDRFAPSYQLQDGVTSGNTDLRVAYSTDNRASWIGMGQTVPDTTFFTNNIQTPDSLATGSQLVFNATTNVYVALARATGTTTNSLDLTSVSVEQESSVPQQYELGQNFPNPFNPSTEFRFSIPVSGMVSLRIFDVLGREVAQLVDAPLTAGTHLASWNASGMPSGVYFYRLQANGFEQTRRMMLTK